MLHRFMLLAYGSMVGGLIFLFVCVMIQHIVSSRRDKRIYNNADWS